MKMTVSSRLTSRPTELGSLLNRTTTEWNCTVSISDSVCWCAGFCRQLWV